MWSTLGVPVPKPLHPPWRQRDLSLLHLSLVTLPPSVLFCHLVTSICGLEYFICMWLGQYVHFALTDFFVFFFFFVQKIKVGHSFNFFETQRIYRFCTQGIITRADVTFLPCLDSVFCMISNVTRWILSCATSELAIDTKAVFFACARASLGIF